MRYGIAILALLLIIGNILPEIQGLMPDKVRDQQLNLFLKPGFKLVDASGKEIGIAFSWWWKILTDDLNGVIMYFVMAMIAEPHDKRLFSVISVLFFSKVADAGLLIWDFKQSYWIYWVLIAASIICVLCLLRVPKMKMVK